MTESRPGVLGSRNEAERLRAVRRYDILDTPPDGAFERITALAARLLKVPISVVTIVDTDRIWFKSHFGVDVEQVDREPGLCASAIMQDEPWLIPDATLDPRTMANSLVAGDFGLRFYAGVPLTTCDGYNLGTLCVIDRSPREVSDPEVAILQDLAAVVMDELEVRLSARQTVSVETRRRRSAEGVTRMLEASLLPGVLPEIDGLRIEARYHVVASDEVGGDFYDLIDTEDGWMAVVGDVCGKGITAASLAGTARWTLRGAALEVTTPAGALDRLNRVLTRQRDRPPDQYCTLAAVSVHQRPGGGATLLTSLGGHPHPLILRSDGRVERTGVVAPIVGSFPDAKFTNAAAELAPGDVLLMFTDGMLDKLDKRGSMDDASLQQMLGALAGRTTEEIADRFDAVLGEGHLRDDAAFLVIGAV